MSIWLCLTGCVGFTRELFDCGANACVQFGCFVLHGALLPKQQGIRIASRLSPMNLGMNVAQSEFPRYV